MELLSVPFSTQNWTESYEAVITVRGLLRNEPQGLALEFRRSEHSYGIKPTREDPIRTISIPWEEIQSLGYRRRFWGSGSLVLRTRSLRALENLPIAQGNELVIPIARADRLVAREIAASVELALAEQRIAAFDAPSAPPSLPPG